MHKAQTSYSFPILKPADLISQLQELDIHTTDEELGKPKEAFVNRIFQHMVEILMGIPKDDLIQASFSGLKSIEYPQLHEESIPKMNLFRKISKLMLICGIHDFVLTDIIKPDPSRLIKQLSGLINFYKFRQDQVENMSSFLNEIDTLRIAQDKLLNEKNELLAQIKAANEKKESEIPIINDLQGEVRNLKSTLKQAQADMESQKVTYENLKQTDGKLKDEITETQYQILENKSENETLRSQVVNSPARLINEIEALSNSVDDKKIEVSELENKKKEIVTKVEGISKHEKELDKTMILMEEIEAEMNKCRKTTKDMKIQKAQTSDNQAEMLEYSAEEQHFARLLSRVDDKLSALRANSEIKTTAAEEALRASRSELDNLCRDLLDKGLLQNEAEKKVREMEAQLAELRIEHGSQLDEPVKQFSILLKTVKSYHENLFAHSTLN